MDGENKLVGIITVDDVIDVIKDEATEDIYSMTEAERRAEGISSLPADLFEAVAAMESSDLLRETLGDHVFEYFVRNKRAEWEAYKAYVSPWEIERSLPIL